MQSSDAPMKIEPGALVKYTAPVSALLEKSTTQRTERTSGRGYASSSSVKTIEESIEILKEAREYGSKDSKLLADMVNHALHIVQRGIELGLHISELYKNASGLDLLNNQNTQGGGFKTDAERVEFNKKNQTAARIVRFVAAYFVVHQLSDYHSDAVNSVSLPDIEKPELDDQTSRGSVLSMVFYYGDVVQRLKEKTPESFVKLTKTYFQHVLDEVTESADSLPYAEPFRDRAYMLEGTDFVVHGFVTESRGATSSAEFSRISFDNIVGNRAAKHEARRLVLRLCSYDPETERNPYTELTGRFQAVRLGHGVPGTGKTLQIGATATLIFDMCSEIGIPFVYNPLEPTVVSTFQGGSAERMQAWFDRFKGAKQIVYAPIDDAEQLLQDRTMQGVSAGVREVISLFLTGTEGAGATYMKRGNAVIETFTNLPEQIDPAVMSRHQSRFPIDGARRWEDFLDQDYLWRKEFVDVVPEFVADMRDPEGYVYMQLQGAMENLSAEVEHYTEPKNPTMKAIFNKVVEEHDIEEYQFFAVLAAKVQKEFPKFSSREIRNIQSQVSNRMVDFDAPEEWMEDPEMFFRCDYDTKLAMLKDLMRENMRGLKLQDVLLQETCRYLDTFAGIEEMQFQRDVAGRVAEMKVMQAAQRELASS